MATVAMTPEQTEKQLRTIKEVSDRILKLRESIEKQASNLKMTKEELAQEEAYLFELAQEGPNLFTANGET
jgi:uncharacterized coiled-coil protein SlyX